MDARERGVDLEEVLRSALTDFQARMWTSAPAKVVSYDPAKQTISAQITVKSFVRQPDGTQKAVKIPVLQDVPVQFPGGGGLSLTFPVKPGDECLICFSSRSPDNWQQSGGEQRAADASMHSLSNGFAMLGFRSNPEALPNASTTGAQIRTKDGKHTFTLGEGGGFTMNCDGTVFAFSKAGLDITGGNVRHNGKNIGDTHMHSGVTTGSETSGTPT